jgi:translation elongation factor EF-1alpha
MTSEIPIKRFVAIGHVDTGKSCLCGRLLYACNYIDEHRMDQIRHTAKQDKMERWVWSRILDIYKDEMLRGKTHEFTTVDFDFNKKKYQLIDTPGHKGFVRSMIQGISGEINIAVLLLSVVDNEFESSFGRGMLKEHLTLARAAGIEHLIIVGNKMDLIDWSQDIYQKKVDRVMRFLKKLKWKKDKITNIPMSAFNGIGLIDHKGYPEWYKGHNLLETLDSLPATPKKDIVGEKKRTDIFIAKIMILNCGDTIITAGYQCMVHFQGKESEMSIIKIKNKRMARVGDIINCKIQFPRTEDIYTNMRLILRRNDHTIGFGKVL